jgi:hypothetical protein
LPNSLGDLKGIGQRFREIAKQLLHFRRRLEIKFRRVVHPVFVLHHLASADAKHDVVRVVIAPSQKMNVVRRNHPQAQVPGNFRQNGVALLLFLQAVIVQFNKEIFRAQNVTILGGGLLCLLQVVRLNRRIDFAGKTPAQTDQSR